MAGTSAGEWAGLALAFVVLAGAVVFTSAVVASWLGASSAIVAAVAVAGVAGSAFVVFRRAGSSGATKGGRS